MKNTVKKTASTSTERSRKYRNNLKNDSKKHEEAKKKDKERKNKKD